jgi:hypothetical protein
VSVRRTAPVNRRLIVAGQYSTAVVFRFFRIFRDRLQDIPETVEWDQSIRFDGLDNTVEDGTGPGAVGGIREHPVFTANDEGFHRALYPIVIDSEQPI